MSKEGLKIFLDKRIADIKRYLEFNGREEDEDGFSPSEELTICNIAKNTIDLEEQIGCPLKVREQALKQGFIYNGFTKLLYICCRYDENGCYLTNGAVKFYLKDYKKRFWLREDKSE